MINQLGERESKALLSGEWTGRLGCSDHGKPYIVPVHYLFDNDCVYVQSTPGHKIDVLRDNPNACLQVDEVRDDHWSSVLAFGLYEEVKDIKERERVMADMFKRWPQTPQTEPQTKKTAPDTIIFRIRVTDITGVYENQ
ncbi:MAG: pyridoxamine 5'-phosphate oxidase family protein [Chloracidobacterium sp.]|nr:pyridoxamine 5'-phosphate oxidase family protein [Chloracidobacterium sp.]